MYMDAYSTVRMQCSYFQSLDYLIVQECSRGTLLYPTNIQLAGPNVHHYTKSFPGVIGYDLVQNIIVSCHRIVTVLDVPHQSCNQCISSSIISNLIIFLSNIVIVSAAP